MGKNLPASAGDIRDASTIPDQEDPLEEGMATHSNILAWRIPWTEQPGRLQSIGSQTAGHHRVTDSDVFVSSPPSPLIYKRTWQPEPRKMAILRDRLTSNVTD